MPPSAPDFDPSKPVEIPPETLAEIQEALDRM